MTDPARHKTPFPLKELYQRIIHRFTGNLNKNTIEYWQQVIFYTVYTVICVLGVFIYVPSVAYAVLAGKPWAIVIDTACMGTLIYVVSDKRLSFRKKAYIGSYSLFFLSIGIMLIYGPAGDSRFWGIGFVFFTSFFINMKASVFACVLNLVTQVGIGVLFSLGLVSWHYLSGYTLLMWMVVSLNFFFFNVLIAFAVNTLLDGVRKTFHTINQTKGATIIGLAKLAEYRDSDTGAHLERMSELAALIARELMEKKQYSDYITSQYIDDLIISSTLHDIGKVGIPDQILLKPGKLTPEEFELIKKHTLFGASVIEEISKKLGDRSFLDMARAIAYYHHEKWDGTGYPDGLAGESIPLSARIVALTDVYDALTSKRSYKEAYSHEHSVELIVKERRKHFDPAIVDVFVRRKDDFKLIRNRIR